MLNPFPELLTYSLMGPFILRAVLGIIFIDLGLLKLKAERANWTLLFETLHLKPAGYFVKAVGLIEIIGGLMLLFGFYTQIAALVFVIFTGIELYLEWKDEKIIKRDFVFYALLFAIALSLLLTGAGAFAFDIPL